MQAMIRLLICDKKLNALDRTEYDQAFLAAFGGTYALDPNSWKNIVSVSCEDMKIVGLRENGMTVASGFSPEDTEEHEAQKTITAWNHLADISLHGNEVVGLKSSGDIVIKKIKKEKDSNLSVCGWKDVISITGRSYELYGLVYDGTILMTCPSWLKLTTPKWTGITALKCAGNGLLAGLDKNGRVVFDGKIAAWEGITKLAGGGSQIIGLKTDGTVCAAGSNGANQAETSEWKNIVAIAAAADFSYGLCADGTVVATSIVPGVEVGPALFGELEGSVRKLLAQKAAQIREEERIAEQCRKEENDRKCRELSEKIAAAQQRQSAAKTELANLKGLFTGKRRKELEAEIASLDRQIADLQKQLDAIRD